ncbi:cell wall-active antibiotics response protein LiaF [Streptococcus uberis]|uniref:cell wall-active antibiotics response protein LiaF n=1 Tax=Streptococcus uberis TaxID=1349 RepID=UPI000543E262|nr:cell wall-active antibiotics response protein LiaF [Streptococcus uberis]KHD39629.1 transporter [Streptococcus hongkongensis]MCK1189946.1 cell wall-active antibiotics response protein LiaF [Streptococcus uberis]MCK1217485.1 cell wall-active antibiotics response protein LiaF [Streptococcus uberis]MCK1226802.1 cell wall-active antibiotics response protein LiaF [Streptococcus uberis]MCK1229808.1 cell wall-active antibiotics response protein LiaF [Streptococcus uberis]
MKKFQFFLLVECILLAMGIMTILANDVASFIFIVVIILSALRFYNRDDRNNFILTVCLLLLFLIFMLNPYIILAVLFAIIYVFINHFSQVKKKNRFALIRFSQEGIDVKKTKHQWIGAAAYESDYYAFDDINIIRISGNDTIDLSNVIVTGQDNVIIIRKIFGNTKVVIPIDVSAQLDVSSIYASVVFLGCQEYDLRNESIKLGYEGSCDAHKKVKIIVNTIAGNVEVVRR